MLFIAISIIACKKEEEIQIQQTNDTTNTTITTPYVGTYVKTTGNGMMYDTVKVTNNNSYYIDRLYVGIGNNILINVTGSSIEIPNASYYPHVALYIVGTGMFTDTSMTVNFTVDDINHGSVNHGNGSGIYRKL